MNFKLNVNKTMQCDLTLNFYWLIVSYVEKEDIFVVNKYATLYALYYRLLQPIAIDIYYFSLYIIILVTKQSFKCELDFDKHY